MFSSETFLTKEVFRLHGVNDLQIRRRLARTPESTETESGMQSRYVRNARSGGKSAHEIEDICADYPDRQEGELAAHPSEFAESRKRIGVPLRLPTSFTTPFGRFAYFGNRGKDCLLLPASFNEAIGRFAYFGNRRKDCLLLPASFNEAIGQFAYFGNRIGDRLLSPKRLDDLRPPERFNVALGRFAGYRSWVGVGPTPPKRFNEAFGQFAEVRNRIGDLLRPPKRFNAVHRDLPH